MIADGLTKPLGPIAFKEFHQILGTYDRSNGNGGAIERRSPEVSGGVSVLSVHSCQP